MHLYASAVSAAPAFEEINLMMSAQYILVCCGFDTGWPAYGLANIYVPGLHAESTILISLDFGSEITNKRIIFIQYST
jgi:hypothetical protein